MFRKIPSNVLILGLVSFFNDVASEMIYPIVPIFMTTVLAAPVEIVGLIEGIAEGTASLTKFLFGYWSDQLKRRKLFVVWGYSFGACSKLLIGIATSWQLVLFARVIDRLGKGLRTAPRDALLLQNATQQNKGFIFGVHRAMDSAGAVVGPLVALLLLSLLHNNIRLTFFYAFVPAVVGLLLLVLFIKEKKVASIHSDTKSQPFVWSWSRFNPSLKLFFFVSMLFMLGNSSDAFLILRANALFAHEQLNATVLTVLVYVVYNVSQTAFAAPAGHLADKIGAKTVYMYGLIIFALVYFFFGFIQHSIWLWVIFGIYGVYIAFTDGVSKAYIAEFITQKESGSYFGLYQTMLSLCTFLASFAGGLIWQHIGSSSTFYFGAIMAGIALLVLVYGQMHRKL